MDIYFNGDINALNGGIEILGKQLCFEVSEKGIPVIVEMRSGCIEVGFKEGRGYIKAERKIHFFRALGLFVEHMRKGEDFCIIEEPQFEMNGIMVDVSRNAVLKVKSIKKLLENMATMGLDMMMLYTEDTYEISGKPYFGYMRGRYSFNELKECDDYADIFGIEIVPCIQTLGHLEQALKWSYANNIRDTSDILLEGCEETYVFIEDMIKAASAQFRSKKIHLGMDEAHNLGLGRYLDKNGYSKRFDIMSRHINKVKEITDKYGLEPMIWSDMYFRLGSKAGEYYDLASEIPAEIIDEIPENLDLVYWDYYHNEEIIYTEFLKKHKTMGDNTIFAGGIWTWNGMAVNYHKSFVTTNAGLSACKKEGIKKVFATLWGDNGAETNVFTALLGLQLFAEHGYSKDISMKKLRERFEFCTKGKYDAFMDLSCIDTLPELKSDIANPSKYLLWQDILIGLFDKHVEGLDLKKYYSNTEEIMLRHVDDNKEWGFVFNMPAKLCSVLKIKSTLGVEIKKFYDLKDVEALQNISQNTLPELYNKINDLRLSHREQWLYTCKPFGWEVIDIRYGGTLARINTAIDRLNQYVKGDIDNIEELEEERLFFNHGDMPLEQGFGSCNLYHRIVSASPIG
ncbi:beta-N-acetylhexosaminidase [Clostridium swellfunianum]|uniref:beta-N-acetylhexosaminidase n=1 Tax=Clostridium swellfunianum TaxID=1367462 RepID=UPI002030424E|nr:beta-N-acetylhexosaminidase [Clostridium swellfunianum]MCM0649977.1 beta-N-acetylhexosaminidase [Clostridium swellfunianum]